MKKIFALLCATLLTLAGCGTDYEILQSYDSVILTADNSNRLVGQTITFTAKDNNGTDHTAEASFFVDGNEINGNTFTSDVIGSHIVTARYGGLTSQELTVSFGDGSDINFRKRVLIEDYTGTWCGWCTRVAYAIELVHAQTDDVVVAAIHRPSSISTSDNYDPFNYDSTELENTLNAIGYPKGFLNRRTRWTAPEPNNINKVIALTQGENPRLGLALTPTVANGTVNLNVNVKFSKDFTNLKLVVYVLENGLVYEQHNYTNYYDGVDVIEDWVHNHVLRAPLTNIMGDAIDNAQTTTYNTFTRTFSVPVPANVTNAANLEFVAFVVDADGNALNVRSAKAGDVQDFEILE